MQNNFVNNSIRYGLANPAFTDDYAMTMFNRQFPTNIDPSYGFVDPLTPQINGGQPSNDIYQSKQQKEYSVLKKVLFALGILGATFIGIKTAPKILKSGFSKIGNFLKNGYTKVSSFTKNIFNKIKTKISP